MTGTSGARPAARYQDRAGFDHVWRYMELITSIDPLKGTGPGTGERHGVGAPDPTRAAQPGVTERDRARRRRRCAPRGTAGAAARTPARFGAYEPGIPAHPFTSRDVTRDTRRRMNVAAAPLK
ncbi:hypothetical protein GCM10010449_30310 [Streptomyces rectiviolaceus]|uniref:Uncharacterized protein n=1 Tax=Streptomyces rectiviolaceus TaxID=332591 RepID=A0ABP6MG02_9ACTN